MSQEDKKPSVADSGVIEDSDADGDEEVFDPTYDEDEDEDVAAAGN